MRAGTLLFKGEPQAGKHMHIVLYGGVDMLVDFIIAIVQLMILSIGAKDHIGLCPAVNLLKAGKHTARHAGHKGISHRRFHAVSHAFQLHARNVGQNLHP